MILRLDYLGIELSHKRWSDYPLCHQYRKKISFEVQVSELWTLDSLQTVVCRLSTI